MREFLFQRGLLAKDEETFYFPPNPDGTARSLTWESTRGRSTAEIVLLIPSFVARGNSRSTRLARACGCNWATRRMTIPLMANKGTTK